MKTNLFALLTCLLLLACGYTLKQSTTRSPLLVREGVHKVYIAPVKNNSYKPGVEITVYNELLKYVSSQDEVELVLSPDEADAIISGAVGGADYSPSGYTDASSLEPTSIGEQFQRFLVPSIFTASLSCTFNLQTSVKNKTWGASFSRSKTFSANNQLGVLGTTSSIINDSEFDRALSDLAKSMMSDVHESLMARF